MIKEAAQFSYQISLFKNVAWEILHFRFFFIPAFCSFFAEYFYTSLYVFFFLLHVLTASSFVGTKYKKATQKLAMSKKKNRYNIVAIILVLITIKYQEKRKNLIRKKREKFLCKMFSKIFRKSPRSPSHLKTINKITFSFFYCCSL